MAEKQQRRLAAIMFTDIVGYTALMGKDEQKALKLLHKNRDLLKPLIKKHNGEWLKEIGDGTLSSFASAVEAVNCAIDIQRTLRDDPDLTLRIGIHVGDVVFEGGDVFGDGVNVASRIEPLAEPGGICVSDRVYDDIRNQPSIFCTSHGSQSLKGVSRPITVYSLSSDPQGATSSSGTPSTETPAVGTEPTIAVLPFMNMSSDDENEYFCDGMTEEIIDALAKVSGMGVVARTSVFAFKGKQADIRDIGKTLNIQYVLEGSVRKSGPKARITTQLINVDNGLHIWSEKYDRSLEDVFAVQDEIASKVVEVLKVKIGGKNKERLVTRGTDNSEAHTHILKGMYHWNKQTPVHLKQAIAHFKEAINLDPGYALAHARLADSYAFLALYVGMAAKEAMPIAKKEAQDALSLDPDLAEAHMVMGIIQSSYDWDWEGADASHRRSIELKPKSSLVHFAYGRYLLMTSRFDDSLNHLQEAVQLDPISPPAHTTLGLAYYKARQYDAAVAQLEATIAIESGYFLAHHFLGLVLSALGLHDRAVVESRLSVEILDTLQTQTGLAYCLGRGGHRKESEKIVRTLESDPAYSQKNGYFMAVAYMGLDDFDRALDWCESGYENREQQTAFLGSEPIVDPLRELPRFQALLQKIGLDPGSP